MDDISEIIEKLDHNQPLDAESCKQLVQYGLYDNISGILNKHSFDLKLKEIESSFESQSIGVIFADVNALKFMNDYYGHGVGDTLIRRCAFLLISHFGENNCYRISGDEFVVILNDIPGDKFIDEVVTFKRLVHNKDIPPISLGWYYGNTYPNIVSIINASEQRMRNDKEIFYKRFPEFRR